MERRRPPASPSAYFEASAARAARPATRLISVRLTEEQLERLARVGNDEGLSMSETVRKVLDRGLRKKGAKP